MNPSEAQIQSQASDLAVSNDRPENSAAATRMEPSEFDSLLEKAMEVLYVRARIVAQSST